MSESTTGFSTGPWGEGAWGEGAWGGPIEPALQLIAALAVRENLIRLQFSAAIYLTGVLDPPDGSVPERYGVAVVPGTMGMDGTPTRPVNVVSASFTVDLPDGGLSGAYVDLMLDRPMTPYPSQYLVSCNGLFSADLTLSLDPSASSYNTIGVFKQLVVPQTTSPTPTRDFANPQSYSGAVASLPNPTNPAVLGVFSADDTGDYALDSGITAYKKRVWRRLVTDPGGFVHLGSGYGVGVLRRGKKLATAGVVQGLASSAEIQIGQEPETEKVKVNARVEGGTGLTRYDIVSKMRGASVVKFSAPFSSDG